MAVKLYLPEKARWSNYNPVAIKFSIIKDLIFQLGDDYWAFNKTDKLNYKYYRGRFNSWGDVHYKGYKYSEGNLVEMPTYYVDKRYMTLARFREKYKLDEYLKKWAES